MKKILTLAVCAVFLLATAIPVFAIDTQLYELAQESDNELIFRVTSDPDRVIWDHPTLKAGEKTISRGTLILQNNTDTEQTIALRTVKFPYDNTEALRYLNHLHITVSDKTQVLYDGVYSRINDDKNFSVITALEPGAEYALFVDLRCDYTYAGDGLAADDMIAWEFDLVQDTPETSPNEGTSPSGFSDPALTEIIIACAIAAALLGGVFAYDYWMKRRTY